ncbi:MAG: hypothetical protein U0Q16_10915 [Bryobacteraceae bacterium]
MRSDVEFVHELREAVTVYLRALDAWEAAYARFYRMPGTERRISADLEDVHRDYVAAFGALERLTGRAQQLCMRHDIRNPWPAFVRSRPSTQAPQTLAASGVGRNERCAISDCLRQLEDACDPVAIPVPPEPQRGLLRKLREYFL